MKIYLYEQNYIINIRENITLGAIYMSGGKQAKWKYMEAVASAGIFAVKFLNTSNFDLQ